MTQSYRILIQCPETGKMFDSGIRTSGREALSSGLYREGSVNCPYCRQIHSFAYNSFLDVDRYSAAGAVWRPNQ